jgi:hypothetical protein
MARKLVLSLQELDTQREKSAKSSRDYEGLAEFVRDKACVLPEVAWTRRRGVPPLLHGRDTQVAVSGFGNSESGSLGDGHAWV